MNHISRVCSRIYFSKYPCEDTIQELIKCKVTYLVDLTNDSEGLPEYELPDSIRRKHYPTPDQGILSDSKTQKIISKLLEKIQNDNVVCIHCKGGHGRSAVIAAILYGRLKEKSAEEALNKVYQSHQARKIMNPRWKKLGAPQNKIQKDQVRRLLA